MNLFEKDLKSGHEASLIIINTFIERNIFKDIKLHQGYNKEFDAIADSKFKLEFKFDRKSVDTGNFYLEFECDGKPSGIATTQSDFYCIATLSCGYVILNIPVSHLRELIRKCKFRQANTKNQDNYDSRGYLIPLNVLKEFVISEQ